MDKIRILRSSRRNTKSAVAKATTVTLAPVTTSDAVFTTPTQDQWVPFVVLDIGQNVPLSAENAVNSSTPQTNNVTITNLIPLSTANPVSSSIPIITSTVSGTVPTKISQTAARCVTANSNATVTQSLPSKPKTSPPKNESIPETCTITLVRNSPRKGRSRPKAKKNNELLAEISVSKENSVESSKLVVSTQNTVMPSNNTSISSNSVVPENVGSLLNNERVSVRVPVFIQNKAVASKVPVSIQLSSVTTNTSPSLQNSLPVEALTAVSAKDNEASTDSSNLQESEIYPNITNLAPICCVICSLPFPTLTEMQAHYLSEHKNRRSRDNKKRNIATISPEPQPQRTPNLIPIQPKRSIGKVSEEQELNIYVDKSDPKCPVCSISFKTVSEVKDHVKLVHSYRCSECNYTFYTLFEFTCHKCNKGGKKLRVIRKKANQGKGAKDFVPILPKGKVAISTTSSASENTLRENQNQAVTSQSILTNQVATNKAVSPIKLKTVREKKNTELTVVQQEDLANTLPPLLPGGQEPNHVPVSLHPTSLVESGKLPKRTGAYCSEQVSHVNQTELYTTDDNIASLSESPECQKKNSNIVRVLETKNLHCFRFKKDEAYPKFKTLSTDTIKEKIAQLKKNPHLSVSWIPKLKIKSEDDSDFVCGRCNVLCDDMEDYMDHIQDCLTITSVTLEPTSKPPQRILRLQKEVSTFGFQESNNNRYTINKNLITKLKSVFPEIVGHDFSDLNHNPSKRNGTNSLDSSDHLCQSHFSSNQLCQNHLGASESQNESLDKTFLQNQILNMKEEPVDDFQQEEDPLSCSLDTSLEGIECTQTNTVKTGGPSKGMQPMVMIPVAANGEEGYFLKADHLEETTEVNNKAGNIKEMATPPSSSPNSTSWESSSLDLLIDTDDIKMEVEEEIIEDHYEDQL